MRSQSKPINLIFLLMLFAFIPLLPLPGMAATPVVDDTTFIGNNGDFSSPNGDIDLLVLREPYFMDPVDLTPYDNPDPTGTAISGNFSTFGSPDCIQSIFLRIQDRSTNGIVRQSNGSITINDGPTSNVNILGVISDLYPFDTYVSGVSESRLDGTDVLFHGAGTVANDFSFNSTYYGNSVFEYLLYGGQGARRQDDPDPGYSLPDVGVIGDPTDDFPGSIIDISTDLGRVTLQTDLDSVLNGGILSDQNWAVIPVDMDANPGDVILSTDVMLSKIFGSGNWIYKRKFSIS